MSATASPADWGAHLAAVIAEAYCLPVEVGYALARDLGQVLEHARLAPRCDGHPPVLGAAEQARFNAAYERLARAEQVGQGIQAGRLEGSSRFFLTSEVWVGFACGCLSLTYDLRPADLILLVAALRKVLDSYGIPERPLRVLSPDILADLPIDPAELRRGRARP